MSLLDFLFAKHREPAECIITIDGQEITDLYPFLVEVRVECSRRQASTGTLRFETRRDEKGLWIVQDTAPFRPWQPIVVEAAFGSAVEEIIRGYIREMHASYPEDTGGTAFEVQLQDSSLEIERAQRRKAGV